MEPTTTYLPPMDYREEARQQRCAAAKEYRSARRNDRYARQAEARGQADLAASFRQHADRARVRARSCAARARRYEALAAG
jgi:hypothetical protein